MSIKLLCPKKRLHAVQFTGPDSIADLRDLLALTMANDEEAAPRLEREPAGGHWLLYLPSGVIMALEEGVWVVRHFGRRFSVAPNPQFQSTYEIVG